MNKDKVINIVSYILIFIILASSFSIFYYMDYSDTLDNSVMLAESIKKGELSKYYQYAAENANQDTVYSANYEVSLYGIFMLWNLPTVILHMSNGFDYMNSTFALLWCKALILVCLLGTSYILKKIISLYVSDKKIIGLIQKLFLAGSCVIVPSMIACQYDIISLLFMLIGLYSFIKGKNKLFLISFMIAIPLKTFALFIFIPLVLIKEKRIPFIILNCAFVMILQVVFKLPFLGDVWYNICMSTQNRDAIELIIKRNISLGNYSVNLFLFVFVAICIYAYKIKKEEDNYLYKVIYIVSAAMASFIIFVPIRSYWVILLVPFVLMIVLFNRKYFRINMLLYIIGTACYSIYCLMTHWIYSHDKMISKLVLHKFVQIPDKMLLKYNGIQGFFEYYGLSKYSIVLCSIALVAIIAIFVINMPKKKFLEPGEYRHENWFIIWQVLITSGLIILMIYSNMAQSGKPVYSITTIDKIYMQNNLFDNDVIRQGFKVEEDEEINELRFYVQNSLNNRSKRNVLKVTIMQEEHIVLEEIVGVANIVDEQEYILKFNKVKLEAGKEYTLEIRPIKIRDLERNFIYFEVTDELVYNEYPMYINDIPQERNLVFTLR